MSDEVSIPRSTTELASAPQSAPGLSIPAPTKLRSETLGPKRLGLVAGLLFFGVLCGWAASAPLAGAVIGMGVVNPESVRYTIQHLEGGIIKSIRVQEGQAVEVGDELVVLDDTADRANLAALSSQLRYLEAQEARLNAERTDADRIVFPTMDDPDDPVALAARQQERNRFQARLSSMASDKEVLQQRIEQLKAQNAGYDEQLASIRRQQVLFNQEVEIAEEMRQKGLERLPRVLALRRSIEEAASRAGALVANVAANAEKTIELDAQIKSLDDKRREQVETDLAEIRTKRLNADEEVRKINDRLARSVIRSPVSGSVLTIPFRNIGGVVRPGEPIMTIVPTGQPLLINAKIAPRDIPHIFPGQETRVVFPSYSQRTTMRIIGKVQQVSRDALQDAKPQGATPGNTDGSYYLVKVEISREEIMRDAPEIELLPGLPAEIFIATQERTAMEYLLQPLTARFRRAMRDQ
jgi:HlyD family type I secretion membrane fusion protein